MANGALYAFEQDFLDSLASMVPIPSDFSTEVIPNFIGRIQTWHTHDAYLDIGTPETLNSAQELLKITNDAFINNKQSFTKNAFSYLERLQGCFNETNIKAIEHLSMQLRQAWVENRNVFICGNGGSAANAIHIANDLHYGIGACGPGKKLPGLRIEALSANTGIITCLANDTGYENIYAHQLEVKAQKETFLSAFGQWQLTKYCKSSRNC